MSLGEEKWQGWLDSNQRMRESKSLALPLGYTPVSGKRRAEADRSGPSSLMGWEMGLEPTTLGTTIRCSNQLSYTHHSRKEKAKPQNFAELIAGTPEGTRTPGPLLRRQLLYPPELQARMERVMGIEPTRPAWKAGILPLNYTRMGTDTPQISA